MDLSTYADKIEAACREFLERRRTEAKVLKDAEYLKLEADLAKINRKLKAKQVPQGEYRGVFKIKKDILDALKEKYAELKQLKAAAERNIIELVAIKYGIQTRTINRIINE